MSTQERKPVRYEMPVQVRWGHSAKRIVIQAVRDVAKFSLKFVIWTIAVIAILVGLLFAGEFLSSHLSSR